MRYAYPWESQDDTQESRWWYTIWDTGLKDFLKSKQIDTIINYPVALPFLKAYDKFSHSHEDFPNAYNNQSQILSLPIFPEMTEEQIEYTIQSIYEFFE